ncbi:hypothetical protein [Stutzerimonas kunmingensis]|uniref:hypothetical protein n=1 Tax=Stutzerimonas kunmingensis TaxID=1211807 RepID=UPI0028AC6391|nr:hypothetical protein [Stutzerimonas kunmingensis]
MVADLTLQQAIGDPLGITLAKHPPLRNSVNTLARALDNAKLIVLVDGSRGATSSEYRKLSVTSADAICLVNAVLLQGIFSEPKVIIKLITDPAERRQHATIAKSLLLDRQSVAGLGLVRPELALFLDLLCSDADLRLKRLPNPFADALPQMGLGPKSGSLLKTLAIQTAVLSLADSMMAYYLDGEIEKAWGAALRVETDNPLLLKYRALILRQHQEAVAFDALLDDWR